MKLQFKIQQYQTDAVEAAVQVFSGQRKYERTRYNRDMGSIAQMQMQINQLLLDVDIEYDDILSDTGYKNEQIELTDEQLLGNIRRIQAENNMHLDARLDRSFGRCSLDIEMETGTGKTYVYIKTIFELNKRYGWSKFIVVVPSVAIREGVKKSFEITADHFMEHYGKKARFFIYNSKNLTQLDSFSASSGINVMIINTQAFAASLNEEKNVEGRKGDAAARIIYSERDEFGSRKPIDVIRANRPIIILDEPQKMGGDVTQKAIKRFDPLFSINYSATHKEKHNLVYVLDALDAYNKRLVKKIEVKGFEVNNLIGTSRYLRLESIIVSPDKPPRAKLEYEVKHKSGGKREVHIVGQGDDLYYKSGELEQYRGFVVSDIDYFNDCITFLNGEKLYIGQVNGDVSEKDMRRIQIRETILSHFEKEERNFERGIKTLSLFFIDEVAKYRLYDEDGGELLGEYARMFEEEYQNILNDQLTLLDTPYQRYLRSICSDPHAAHRGYFSIDKKTGRCIDSELKRGSEFSDDISAYDLILKNKERLLSFDEPTRFIFSHSALREGWDNPNVFQICTLKHSDSTTAKRQEVGRGLRLCVNQTGNRMDAETCGETVHDINMLTVIASESYRDFVGALQTDIKAVLYDRPTKATVEYFAGKTVMVDGQPIEISEKQAKDTYRYLIKNDYIDEDDKVSDAYREALAKGELAALPESISALSSGIHALVQGIFDESALDGMISNGQKTKLLENPLNRNFYKKEFQALWNEINHKYAYTVSFDSDELIRNAILHIDEKLYVSQLQYTTTVGSQKEAIDAYDVGSGRSFGGVKTKTNALKSSESSRVKYDLIGKIAAGTKLTRRTVAAILTGIQPQRFGMFGNNPEEFIARVIELIKEQKATMIVEHIAYNRIDGSFDSAIFTAEKVSQPIEKAFKAEKAIQDYVFTDGYAADGQSTERRFAESLDSADEVVVYAKLPKGFAIPTPVGNYSPDWAIAFREGSVKHIYFVAETKGSMSSMQLKKIEQAKIDCAKRLFNEVSTSRVRYEAVSDYRKMLDAIAGMK